MIERRVIYLMSGQPHLPYLVTSLWTLRRHWQGPVTVAAWPESIGLVRWIAADPRLNVEAVERQPAYRGKNDQFLDKMKLAQSMNGTADVVLYLDADTTIHGSLELLFKGAEYCGFCATQFCDWTTQNPIVQNRVKRLLGMNNIPQGPVEYALGSRWPSVNGGVWAARPSSPVFDDWYRQTMVARSIFIADETVLHALQTVFVPIQKMTTLLGGAWNCSPMEKFQPMGLPDDLVVVRHFHGDSAVRPSKSEKGWRLWSSVFRECLYDNVGRCREWWRGVGNKHMAWIKPNFGEEVFDVSAQQTLG